MYAACESSYCTLILLDFPKIYPNKGFFFGFLSSALRVPDILIKRNSSQFIKSLLPIKN